MATHACPPHHWIIDTREVGVCCRCGMVRDFGKLRKKEEHLMELRSKGRSKYGYGRRGRPRKSEPKLDEVLLL